jgi:ERCC4-related helicase
MFKILNFEPREFQKNIFETCKKGNSLVVVPTGLGKTKIALMLTVEKLNEVKDSKVLIMTPTRPLASQIKEEVENDSNIEDIELVTGMISPAKRKEIYLSSRVIVSTPQTIENDIKNNFIDLSLFSLLVFDEVHRAVKNYAYTKVAKEYLENENSLILGLTASPGSDRATIDEIRENLGFKFVEIRSEEDGDVSPYVQEKSVEWIKVDLPEHYKKIHESIKALYKKKIEKVADFGYRKNPRYIRKQDLLSFQIQLRKQIKKDNYAAYYGLSLIAYVLKLSHLLEMIETQGIKPAYDFILKLEKDTSKAAANLLSESSVQNAKKLMKVYSEQEVKHPKMVRMAEIVEDQVKNNSESRIIVFANFRKTVDDIIDYLSSFEGVEPVKLVGQKEGLKQSEQIQRIRDFSDGVFNCLVCTSIGEEGLSIKSADLAVFYDQTSTSVRKIQRGGRVGRVKPGRVVHLITKGTKDESSYYASRSKEKTMRETLKGMQGEVNLNSF